jgi:DNA-binding transcriptional ArsR family regulator
MDFRRPVEAVIPGVQGRILAVLAETTAELNLRTIARLATVSPAQASRVLPALVTQGLVERREAPPSALFSLVDEHVAAGAVRTLSRARQTVLEQLTDLAGKITPRPVSALVFGSFARGEADESSDLDILLVHSERAGDDERWGRSVEEFRTSAHRLTGNVVQVLEVPEREVGRRLRGKGSVWLDIVRDGLLLHGKSIDHLRARRSA